MTSRRPDWSDDGLAAERTALAYRRSALALAALGALTIHAGIDTGLWPAAVPMTALLAVVAVLTWRAGRGAYAERSRGRGVAPRPQALVLLAASTTLAGLTAIPLALAQ